MKARRVVDVTEKQIVFNNRNPLRPSGKTRVVFEKLVGEYQ